MTAFKPVTAALRALDVLRVLNELERASVAEIHRHTSMPKPTALRMVETLVDAGYVARVDGTTTYTPTGKCLLLSNGVHLQTRMTAKAEPILNAFRRSVGWPSDFAVFDGDAMVITATNREFGTLSLNRKPGARAPLLRSALGRAYLAFRPEDEQQRIIKSVALPPTSPRRAAADLAAITRELHETRARGYSLTDQEYLDTTYEGAIWGIGVPILARNQAVASMNVMFLRSVLSMDSGIAALLRPLQQAASEIGTELAQEGLNPFPGH
jgi:IclR family transcriptional regulator, mhp operon transcriptional activator